MSRAESSSKISSADFPAPASRMISAGYESLSPAIAFLKIVGLDVTPYTEPASISFLSSPDWMSPSLMKSSQMLWPRSCSATAGLFIGISSRASNAALRGREHDAAAFGIDGDDDAMAPGHVGGRTLELDALRRKIAVRAVHVLDHEVERGLFRRTGLAHPLHRRHEADAGRMARLDIEIVHLRILLESPKPK